MNDDVRRGKFLARLRKDKNLKQSDLAKLKSFFKMFPFKLSPRAYNTDKL